MKTRLAPDAVQFCALIAGACLVGAGSVLLVVCLVNLFYQ